MATFEGPMLSIRTVSELAHYTDWIISHVHGGALGWNGFMAAGFFYWVVPQLYGTKLYSTRAANWHFWIGTFGIVLYMAAMYISGITQGLMWRAEAAGGGLLYPSFLETVQAVIPMYWARMIGGLLYLIGFIVMAWNLVMTARQGSVVMATVRAPAPRVFEPVPWKDVVLSPLVLLIAAVGAVFAVSVVVNQIAGLTLAFAGFAIALMGGVYIQARRITQRVHHQLEGTGLVFTALITIAILIGGVAEILPSVALGMTERETTRQQPYTALELEGRDVYVSEGCYTCHSQMIRPFAWESARYGAVSTSDDSVWDRPFQWGSKRTGPDLAREGGRYPNLWHYRHMIDPREISPGSVMPPYAHLATNHVDFTRTGNKMRTMVALGVPYSAETVAHAEEDAHAQAESIRANLEADVQADADSELVALIAYLQRVGLQESTFTPARSQEAAVAAAGGE
jgi:cytochrome c oxidase cbb3-type subunit I/II